MSQLIKTWSETTAAGHREMVRRAPPEHLREFVHGYAGYYDDTGGFRQLTVPSGAVVVILSLGAGLRMLAHPGRAEEHHNSFVAGLQDTPGTIESMGLSYGVQVNLTPVGARLLTGLPMHLLSNRVLDIADVFGTDGTFLVERLEQLTDWVVRFEIIDAFIEAHIAHSVPPAGVLWAYRTLRQTAGSASIASLADSLGQSQKHLITQFREHVGMPPKTMARILRFDRAMQLIRGNDQPDFAGIATECGYYDQAHFNREFREFTGMAPGEYIAQLGPGSDYPLEYDDKPRR